MLKLLLVTSLTSEMCFSGSTSVAPDPSARRQLGTQRQDRDGTGDFSVAQAQEAASFPQLANPVPIALLPLPMEVRAWGQALALPTLQFLPQLQVAVTNPQPSPIAQDL